jgi:hypothetical protein
MVSPLFPKTEVPVRNRRGKPLPYRGETLISRLRFLASILFREAATPRGQAAKEPSSQQQHILMSVIAHIEAGQLEVVGKKGPLAFKPPLAAPPVTPMERGPQGKGWSRRGEEQSRRLP